MINMQERTQSAIAEARKRRRLEIPESSVIEVSGDSSLLSLRGISRNSSCRRPGT